MSHRRYMLLYGLFLVAGALLAISISGWDRSKTALASSGMAAMIMVGCTVASSRPSDRLRAIGTWAGRLFPILFAATFAWRLSINQAKPTPEEWMVANPGQEVITSAVQSSLQNWLFPVFIFGSLTFCALIWRASLKSEQLDKPTAE
jgi:hypothetical protein